MKDADRASFHKAYIQGDKQKIKEILGKEIKSLSYSLVKFCNGSYCSDSSNFYLKSLKEDKLWVSRATEFNDPCEFMFSNDDEKTKELREHCFVSCFSEKTALFSQAMWGYFANCHKGFCLEYSYREMNIRFSQGIVPIRYSDERNFIPDPKSYVDRRAYRLSIGFTKAKEWRHEKEWRLVDEQDTPVAKKGYNIGFFQPLNVYMGVKISPELEKDLKVICSEKKIGLFKMIIKPGTYTLGAEKI